jgi:hypothetical protein
VHSASALVGATGLVYGWMLYFGEPVDEFALVNHPQQPTLHNLHILFAPLLVFACGLLWRSHIWARIRAGFQSKRRSGIALAVLLVPMVSSGYLLQVSDEPATERLWVWTHGLSSCAWILIYIWHQLFSKTRDERSDAA